LIGVSESNAQAFVKPKPTSITVPENSSSFFLMQWLYRLPKLWYQICMSNTWRVSCFCIVVVVFRFVGDVVHRSFLQAYAFGGFLCG